MMDLTNKSLRYSGVQTVLHRLGTAQVDYSIIDSAEFKTDMEELKTGISFQDLRLLRSKLKADLVSLLVFNGEQRCNTANGLASGAGFVPADFMQPKDFNEYGLVKKVICSGAMVFLL